MRRRSQLAVCCALAAAAAAAASVLAAPGGGGALVQLPGATGCLTSDARAGCGRVVGLDAATSVAASADGRSVYVAGLASLAVLSRNPSTGALTQAAGSAGCIQDPSPSWHAHRSCRSVTGFWPTRVAVSPDGRNVYVTSGVDDRAHGGPFSSVVDVFDRSSQTGGLTEEAGACVGVSDSRHCPSSVRGMSYPDALAVSPDGKDVYVGSDGGIAVFRRSSSGALTQLSGSAGCVLAAKAGTCVRRPAHVGGTAALAVSPDGESVYALASRLPTTADNPDVLLAFRRDPTTGALTQVAGPAGCLTAVADASCRTAAGLNGASWEFSIALSRDGRSVYVSSGGGVASFARQSGGRLVQPPGTAGCLGAPDFASGCTVHHAVQPFTGAVVSPDGASVYIALGLAPKGGPGSVVKLVRDPHTGALSYGVCAAESRPGCSAARGLGQVGDVALSPDGRTVYGVGLHGTYPSAARIVVLRG